MPMKISKIEFENFRNFKDHGEIRCSTDGKVTIIYGRIGDGKTTLHQLVQWVFYGRFVLIKQQQIAFITSNTKMTALLVRRLT